MKMLLRCSNISHSYSTGPVLNGISFDVRPGEFLTLLGPSGCGKTTLLRIIAGLESPDEGSIFIQEKDATNLPPRDRPLHVVFQHYALFPHLSVYDNVAFGLVCAKTDKAVRDQKVEQALKRVNMWEHANKKPAKLSGGQQQRVAMARAIVMQPQILLLDEPLSALDQSLRKQMCLELKQLQRELGITFIMITHDQEEALTLSDRIIVMNNGVTQQIGTPREIYEKPVNLFVAKFIGETNILEAKIIQSQPDETQIELIGLDTVLVKKQQLSFDQPVSVIIRPEDTQAWGSYETPKDCTNCLPARVEEIIYKGSTVDLVVRLRNGQAFSVTEFFDENDSRLEYTRGEEIILTWPEGWEMVLPHA